MADSNPSFLGRVSLAFEVWYGILVDAELAGRVQRLRRPAAARDTQPSAAPKVAAPAIKETNPDAALQLLGLLQRNGRFIDFIEEEVAGFSDSEIGVAARVVHAGCRKALREHFTIKPVREETEGSAITLNEGFDAAAIRLSGNLVGKAPFRGSIGHRGWRVTQTRLPKLAEGHDPCIVAPAEVEL